MANNFEHLSKYGHEQLIFCQNRDVGLKAIVAIHDTTLGPALGGTRMWPYQTEEDAILDAVLDMLSESSARGRMSARQFFAICS